MQQTASPTTTANYSVFATLQSNSNLNSNSNSTWYKKCICGLKHRYSDCCYILKQKRPQGWKPDLDIQKKVDEMIPFIPSIKRMLDQIQIDTKVLEAENTESTIDFDSKTLPSTTPTSHAAMFSTG